MVQCVIGSIVQVRIVDGMSEIAKNRTYVATLGSNVMRQVMRFGPRRVRCIPVRRILASRNDACARSWHEPKRAHFLPRYFSVSLALLPDIGCQ